MKRKISGFHQDPAQDWVATLECGHTQHVRHKPPWINHPWVLTSEGRQQYLGVALECPECKTAQSCSLCGNTAADAYQRVSAPEDAEENAVCFLTDADFADAVYYCPTCFESIQQSRWTRILDPRLRNP